MPRLPPVTTAVLPLRENRSDMSGDRTSGSGGRDGTAASSMARSAALADRAPGGAAAVEHLATEGRRAAIAALPGPAVAVEVVLVAARAAVDGAVVAKRRPAVGQGHGEDLADRGVQTSRLWPGDLPCRGVDAGPP